MSIRMRNHLLTKIPNKKLLGFYGYAEDNYLRDMALQLSNEQLRTIAQEFGTPLYLYNADRISAQYAQLQNAFNSSNKVRFFYACKALTNVSILKHIKEIGCNVDCSSINEAKLAVHAGFSPNNILYTSNGIAFDEIEEAVSLGININIDSLANLEKFGKKYGHSYPVGIRLQTRILWQEVISKSLPDMIPANLVSPLNS